MERTKIQSKNIVGRSLSTWLST